EVLELFQHEHCDSVQSSDHSGEDQLFLALSVAVGNHASILFYSGSSHTFISDQVARQLTGVVPLRIPPIVRVANGTTLQCVSSIPHAVWSVQQCQFSIDLLVLPLQAYDMIVGLAWLGQHSPTKVHLAQQLLSIPYHGSTMILYGVLGQLPTSSLIQLCSISQSVDATLAVHSLVVQGILDEFADLFTPPDMLPPEWSFDHSIPLIAGASPVNIRPYLYAPTLKDEIERQVAKMMAADTIQKSSSQFSSPMLLVKKDNSWHFCVDYCHLNAITMKAKYQVPIIDELLDELAGASWFSGLGLAVGFHQICVQPGEEHKTAFQTRHGYFEFCVMAYMNATLAPEDHMQHIRLWKLKLSKYTFAQRQIAYLGQGISATGVATDPQKISAISSWSSTNTKELCSFLGLTSYFRKFVRHFGIISKPLTELLKKNTLFIWTSTHEHAFVALENALCSAHVLALPDFSKVFHVESGDGHPIAYLCKALGSRSQGLAAYEKEYAMLLAQWRPYLLHKEFVINIDQRSLTQPTEQCLHTSWQQKVYSKLIELQYRIQYKPGSDNRVADALSHKSTHESQCVVISTITPDWISKVQHSYQHDTLAQSLLTKLSISPEAVPSFTLGWFYKGSIWVGSDLDLHRALLQAFRSSAVGVHSGFQQLTIALRACLHGRGLNKMSTNLSVNVKYVNKLSRIALACPDCFSPCLCLRQHGRLFLWTLWKAFRILARQIVFQSLLISSPNTVIIPYSTHSRQRQLWRELFSLANVQLCMSSSCHPQYDGQTERVNQCLETYLRCYVHSCPTKWSSWIPLVEYWYNTIYHSAIGHSPFEALYCNPPKNFGISSTLSSCAQTYFGASKRALMNRILQQHLLCAKKRMKQQADKGCSERTF
ncbi:LOW QUALITY PROTEIN: hypothetical protein U9M48_012526, partial [Paspalum notatum var. saurae]